MNEEITEMTMTLEEAVNEYTSTAQQRGCSAVRVNGDNSEPLQSGGWLLRDSERQVITIVEPDGSLLVALAGNLPTGSGNKMQFEKSFNIVAKSNIFTQRESCAICGFYESFAAWPVWAFLDADMSKAVCPKCIEKHQPEVFSDMFKQVQQIVDEGHLPESVREGVLEHYRRDVGLSDDHRLHD
ncbi:MAG: hypothetical protein WBN08_20610 [Thiogranum sp.]